MAIIFSDGFDNYAADADLLVNWEGFNAAVAPSLTGGRFGGGSLVCTGTVERDFLIKTFPEPLGTPTVTGFFNFSFQFTTGTEEGDIIALHNTDVSNRHIRLRLQSGTLSLYRDNTFVVVQTGTPLSPNVWYNIEIMFVAHNTTGRFQMNVDGVEVFNYTGDTLVFTTLNQYDSVRLRMPTGVYDDFIIYTSAGDSPTAFFGDCKITTIRPDGAGNSSDSTIVGAATRHEAVDEVTSDGDTTHVSLATNNDQDLYTMTGIAGTPTIHSVVVKSVTRTDSSDTRTMQNIIRSGVTENQGTSTIIANGSNFRAISHSFPVDPNTAGAWTAAAVNAMEAGQKMSN